MSEEIKAPAVEAPVQKPKQYLLMVDEMAMSMLGKLLPGMLFVQIEGMSMQGNDNHMLLVSPINKPVPVTQTVPGVSVEEQRVD